MSWIENLSQAVPSLSQCEVRVGRAHANSRYARPVVRRLLGGFWVVVKVLLGVVKVLLGVVVYIIVYLTNYLIERLSRGEQELG